MALLHEDSCICASSQLDLFTVPGTQSSQEKSVYVEYYPKHGFRDGGPLVFDIENNGNYYTDLSDTRLYIKARLFNSDDTVIAADVNIAPCNMLLHAMVHKLDVMVAKRSITESQPYYPWKAAIETLLNFGQDAKTSQLQTIGYYKDSFADQNNPGHGKRGQIVSGSRPFELLGPLHVDLFFQQKYLINKVPINLKIVLNEPEFFLFSPNPPNNFKLKIEEASIWLRHVAISPDVELAHDAALQRKNALYPVHRTDIEVYQMGRGQRGITISSPFQGRVPDKLVMVLLENDSIDGSYTNNPFMFKHFNITAVTITLDGDPVGATPLKTDFGYNLYMRAYHNLFNAVNKTYADFGTDITYDDFAQGYSIFCFDLTPDGCGGAKSHFEIQRSGNLVVKLNFADNVNETINVLLYADFEAVQEITRDRELLTAHRP